MDPVSEEPRIRLAKQRLNHYGAFEGLTELWLNARYFESIYANLLETPHDYVALVGADGAIFAYKRVAGYPVYVNFALSKTYVGSEWRSRMAPYLHVCLGATALLLIAA